MGCDLFRRFKLFRDCILECDSIYEAYVGESLIRTTGLFTGSEFDDSPIKTTHWPGRVISAAIVFFQVALFDLMKGLGFKPDVIIGHSLGECTVLYASGLMPKEAVIQIAAARGRALELVGEIGGAMVALNCTSSEAEALIQTVEHTSGTGKQLYVAAYNSPGNIAVSGPSTLIDYLINFTNKWHMGSVKAVKLRVSIAMHSPFVDACEQQFRSDLAGIFAKYSPRSAHIPVISSVTGDYMHGEDTIDYLWKNMRRPVQFSNAVRKLVMDFPEPSCIEFSPHPVLGAYVREIGPERVFPLVSRPKGSVTEVHSFLRNLGEITNSGINCLNFAKLNGEPKERLALKAPAYPFQYKMKLNWADLVPGYYQRLLPPLRPLNEPLLKISPELPGTWMGSHIIDKSNLVPASVYMEMAFEFPNVVEIYDVQFNSAFALDDVNFSVSTLKVSRKENIYEICSSSQLIKSAAGTVSLTVDELGWAREPETSFDNLHSTGKLSCNQPDIHGLPRNIDIDNFISKCTASLSGARFYEETSEILQFGLEFKRLVSVHWDTNNPYECIAYIRGMEMLETNFQFHPVVSDAMIQAAAAGFTAMTDGISPTIKLPHSVKRVFRNDGLTEPLLLKSATCPVYCRLVEWDSDYTVVDIFLLADSGSGKKS